MGGNEENNQRNKNHIEENSRFLIPRKKWQGKQMTDPIGLMRKGLSSSLGAVPGICLSSRTLSAIAMAGVRGTCK